MTTPTLSHLERVPLRKAWPDEARDFTPWLAEDENLRRLGETLGLDLEAQAREHPVGPFSADILAKDTATDTWVLIENQLAPTDHKHLGQLLTYAAGLHATTVVWVAERFTDQHRATLDWLNEISSEDINFFGLQITLWRIGNSPWAPSFEIVSRPNNWSKAVAVAAEGSITSTQQLQYDYWSALREYMQDHKGPVNPVNGRRSTFVRLAIGRSKFHLIASVSVSDKWIRAEVTIDGPDAGWQFARLQEQRETIQQELDFRVEWDEEPGRKQRRIRCNLPDADPSDREDWTRQHRWFADHLYALHRVFAPRIAALPRDSEREAELIS